MGPFELGVGAILPKPPTPFARNVTVAFYANATGVPVEMEPGGLIPIGRISREIPGASKANGAEIAYDWVELCSIGRAILPNSAYRTVPRGIL